MHTDKMILIQYNKFEVKDHNINKNFTFVTRLP